MTEFENNQGIISAFKVLVAEIDNLIIQIKVDRDIQFPEYILISKKDEQNNFPRFEIQENMITQTPAEYLLQKKWLPNPEIKALSADVFKLKTNFNVKSFEDIVRLNNAQKEEVANYEIFFDSANSKPPLQILYENSVVLNKLLKETFDEMSNPKNNKLELQEITAQVSENYKRLNVQFYTEADLQGF